MSQGSFRWEFSTRESMHIEREQIAFTNIFELHQLCLQWHLLLALDAKIPTNAVEPYLGRFIWLRIGQWPTYSIPFISDQDKSWTRLTGRFDPNKRVKRACVEKSRTIDYQCIAWYSNTIDVGYRVSQLIVNQPNVERRAKRYAGNRVFEGGTNEITRGRLIQISCVQMEHRLELWYSNREFLRAEVAADFELEVQKHQDGGEVL